MKRIWSPWRMKYIQNSNPTGECPFCTALEYPEPGDHFLLYRGIEAFVIFTRYPYTTGHLLILPLEHQENMDNLDPETGVK